MIKSLFLLSSVFLGTYASAQTIVFSENFDSSATQELWKIEDQDGDFDTWEFMSAEDTSIETFKGGFAWSWSWLVDPLFPDNRLTSPLINLPKDNALQLNFKIAAASNTNYFQENYAVYVLPESEKSIDNQQPIFEETLSEGFYEEGKLINLDLSDYAGQSVKLVFRHYNSSDLLYIGLDDVEIIAEPKEETKMASVDKQTVYKDANQNIRIKGLDGITAIRLFDLKGKLMIESTTDQLNVSTMPAGIYIVNFYTREGVISRKIIK